MSYIYQGSAGASDSYFMTISMWIKVPDGWDGSTIPLMSWGTVLSGISQSSFYIYGIDRGISAGAVLYGEYNSFTATNDVDVTPFVGGDSDAIANGPVFHVMAAFDTSGESFEQTFGSPDSGLTRTHHLTMKCVINGATASLSSRRGGFEPDLIISGDYSFPVSFSGLELGIPVSPNNVAYGNRVTLGQVQIYIGQFIDPTNPSNFSKFVELRDGRGYQVDASEAADVFGSPTYCFYGDNSSFPINRGTGGAFSTSGIMNNKPGLFYS